MVTATEVWSAPRLDEPTLVTPTDQIFHEGWQTVRAVGACNQGHELHGGICVVLDIGGGVVHRLPRTRVWFRRAVHR